MSDDAGFVVEVAADAAAFPYRLVVAPCDGRFVPRPAIQRASRGHWLDRGQIVGEIDCATTRVPVRCPTPGSFMGMLALPGQPVHEGEALLWMNRADS